MHRRLLLQLAFMAGIASAFQRAFGLGARKAAGGGGSSMSRSFAATTATQTTAAPADVAAKYEELCRELREIEALQGIQGLLGWDEQTMMPAGAAAARGAQKAALAGTLHEKRTRPALGEMILGLDKPEALALLKDDFERANVRLSRREWDLETRKTKAMASKEAELEAKGYGTWVQARESSDFQAFAPVLAQIFELKGEIARATRPDRSAYDGNIDAFEINMRSERLAEVFAALKADLVPLLQRVMASPRFKEGAVPALLEPGPQWDKEAQVALSKEISGALGFDYQKGRIDVSVHPFTGGSHPTDVRITTRYSDNWSESVSGTVHEVGHALYEQGRSTTHNDLPVSRALSMGAHESQSLIWERMVFQGKAFWEYATPLFHKYFPHTKEVTADQLYRHINRVQPGLIRVNADEVTYPLHIVLRFEMERALFEGSITVEELPAVWNKRMKELLGVEVPSDKEGVLQDVHWGVGAIGYFPSYTLGAMTAAQLYEAAKAEMPALEQDLAAGRFTPLREWLQAKVHTQGSLPESLDALLVSATGKPLDPKIFVRYLEDKYTALYDLGGAAAAAAGKGGEL